MTFVIDSNASFHAWMLLVSVGVLLFAAFAHSAFGFGFPMISMQVTALMADMKTAVILALFPNIAVNLISIAAGEIGA